MRTPVVHKRAPYADVEAEVCRHPAVRECAVTQVRHGSRQTLTAYIVTSGNLDTRQLRAFLTAPRLRSGRIPRATVPVRSLPRTATGEVDYASLPLPIRPSAPRPYNMKSGGAAASGSDDNWPMMMLLTFVAGFVAFTLTHVLWPYSTDVSAVPQPWAGLFVGLYIAEWLSFGLGVAVLLAGRRYLSRRGRPPWLTNLAHLSVVWLLVAWWPQDNFYRLAAKADWPRQAALVYGFNITLMLAAALLFAYLAFGGSDRDR